MARRKIILEGVRITGIADKGKAAGRDQSGEVVFVEGAVPGDVLDVLVIRKRKGIREAVPVRFLEHSPDKVEPFCSHFSICGGCKWQNLDYTAQLQHKQLRVADAFSRIGHLKFPQIRPIIGSADNRYYRNKLEFSFSNKRWLTREEIENADTIQQRDALGFHKAGAFDKIIDITKCYLQPDPSNKIRNLIRQFAIDNNYAFYDSREKTGWLRNVIVRNNLAGEVMLLFAFNNEDTDKRNALADFLLSAIPEVKTMCYVINSKLNDSIFDLEVKIQFGDGFITEDLAGIQFRIGPKSFFQTNPVQTVELYQTALDLAGLKGDELVYDLYTGIGSIALHLAKRCKKVIGIEEIKEAVEDANTNAKLNDIQNVEFFAGDVAALLRPEFIAKKGKPQVIVTDPPRAGMHKKVTAQLLEMAIPHIVYISCNPATQARDIQILNEKYEITAVQPVDMFPHTHHVENVVALKLNEIHE